MTYFIDKTDARICLLAQKLIKQGKQVLTLEKGVKINPYDCLIFSPAKKFENEFLNNIPNNIKLVCGALNDEQIKIIQNKNITYKNLMNDEIFAIKNANLTAEGVLAIILEKSPKSITKNNVLILGGGRIALALAVIFNKLGVKFGLVSYNKEKFPKYYLYTDKCYYKDSFIKDLKQYDVVINTIPKKIIDDENLLYFLEDCLFIETASIDCLDKNKVTTFNYIKAPALPSKYCVETASDYIFDAILGENDYEN